MGEKFLFTLEPVTAWVTRWEEQDGDGNLVLRGNGQLKHAEVFRRSRPLTIAASDILQVAQYVMEGNMPETLLPGAKKQNVDWTVDFTSPNSVRIVSRYPFEEVRRTGILNTGKGQRPEIQAEWLIRQVEQPTPIR